MTGRSKRRLIVAALAAGLALGAGAAVAQEFPAKPITMIIPLGAGGSHDLNARVMTSVLSTYLGQPVVVQLMPGASGQTGTAAAAQAAKDGYTLLYTHNFIDMLQQHVSKLPYDPLKDFVTVARPNYGVLSVIVRADSKFKTLKELLDYGKQNPGKLTMGHSGMWGAIMVPAAALLSEAGVKAQFVPYQGGGPVMQALLSGDVDFTMGFPAVILGQGDKVRVLASIGDTRIFDGVPTTKELGYERVGDTGIMHRVVVAPRGIPEDRLKKLREGFAKMAQDKTYQALLKKLEENNEFMGGDEYEKVRARQNDAYKSLVRELTK